MARRSSRRSGGSSRRGADNDAEPEEEQSRRPGRKRPGRTSRQLRAAGRISSRRGESAEEPQEQPEPKRASKRNGRRDSKANSRKSKRSKKQSKREEEPRSAAAEDRRAKAEAAAAKKKKKTITLAVVGGVALLLLLIFAGPLQRMYHFHNLRSSNAYARDAALQSLLTWKDSVRPGLLEVVRNKSGDWSDASRYDACRGLALLQLPTADKALAELALQGDKEPKEEDIRVRYWVMEALVQSQAIQGQRYPTRIFVQNAAQSDVNLRLAATKGLGFCKGRDSSVIDALLDRLRDNDNSVRAAAITSFTTAGEPKDTTRLLEFLTSEMPERRDAANAIFKHFDSPDTNVVLGHALEKAKEDEALTILNIYKGFNNTGGMAEPIGKAIGSTSMKVRIKALEVAGHKRLHGTEQKILEATRADIPEIRVAAAKAVQAFGEKKLAQDIHKLLEDGESTVRQAAMDAVAGLGDRSATPALAKLLDHEDEATVTASIRALGTLFPQSAKVYRPKKSMWKLWWERYGYQKEFVDDMQKHQQKIVDLLGNQDNKSYKRILELIATDTKYITKFLGGKFPGKDGKDARVIPELKTNYSGFLKDLQAKMNKWKYDSLKLQTN